MDYNKIKKSAQVQSLKPLPEGYGRSVVGGREIITRPSQKAVANPQTIPNTENQIFNEQHVQGMDEYNEEQIRNSVGYVPDLSQSFEPDSQGIIGDYHIEDLAEQYAELKSNSTPEEMDAMVTDMDMVNMGIYDSKFLKNGRKYAPGEEEEAVRMLGTSIKYGRGR